MVYAGRPRPDAGNNHGAPMNSNPWTSRSSSRSSRSLRLAQEPGLRPKSGRDLRLRRQTSNSNAASSSPGRGRLIDSGTTDRTARDPRGREEAHCACPSVSSSIAIVPPRPQDGHFVFSPPSTIIAAEGAATRCARASARSERNHNLAARRRRCAAALEGFGLRHAEVELPQKIRSRS